MRRELIALRNEDLTRVLSDTGLAQLGDALLNFAYSVALTEMTGRPMGTKVSDKTLAEAAVKAGLRKHLPRRVGRGDVANSLEALLGYIWVKRVMTLDEILASLKAENTTPVQSFVKLAESALARLER